MGMRGLAVAAILVGTALCASGLLVIVLANSGFEFQRSILLLGARLHISPLWTAETGVLADPQNVTIRNSDLTSALGLPYRRINLTSLPIPANVLDASVFVWFDLRVPDEPVNFYLMNQENLTAWEGGGPAAPVIAWDNALGHYTATLPVRRADFASGMCAVVERAAAGPTDVVVSLALTAFWMPRTDASDAAYAEARGPAIEDPRGDVRLEGNATEANGTVFGLLIFDEMAWQQRSEGDSPSPLFEGNGSRRYSFVVPLRTVPAQYAPLHFVATNAWLFNRNLDVNVSAQLVWELGSVDARSPLTRVAGTLAFAGVAMAAAGTLAKLGPDPRRKSNG